MPSFSKVTSEVTHLQAPLKRLTESSISKFLLLDSKICTQSQLQEEEDGTPISRIFTSSVEEVEVTPMEEADGLQPLVFKTFTWLLQEETDNSHQALLFKILNSSAEEVEVTPTEEDSEAGILVSRTSEKVTN